MYKLKLDWEQKLKFSLELNKIPILAGNIDENETQRIIVGVDKIYAFSTNGIIQWIHPMSGYVKLVQIESLHTCNILENILVASCRVFDAVVSSSALIIQKAQSELKLLDINGEEKEAKTFEGSLIRDIDVANIDSDGNKEIILGLGQIGNRSEGEIVVYSFRKGITWERPFSNPIISLSCINNNQFDYIITAISQNGKVIGINNRGDLIWEYLTSSNGGHLTKLPHPNNKNGNLGIIASSGNKAWCLDINGKCLWHYKASSSISAIHIVLHPGSKHSILIGSKDALHLIDYKGNLRFKKNLKGKIYLLDSMITNKDRTLIFIACSKDGQMYLISESGSLLLKHDEGSQIAGYCPLGIGPNQELLLCVRKPAGRLHDFFGYRSTILKKYSILS
jgi:outer membrane protein assembly factor BamB